MNVASSHQVDNGELRLYIIRAKSMNRKIIDFIFNNLNDFK